MKNNFIHLTLLGLGMFLISCQASKEEATAFNNTLVSYDDAVMTSVRSFQNALAQYDSLGIVNNYEAAKNAIQLYRDSINMTKIVNGGSKMHEALLQKHNGYMSLLDVEYKKLIELFNIPENSFGEMQKKEWDAILEIAGRKQDSLYGMYLTEQQIFAKENGLLDVK